MKNFAIILSLLFLVSTFVSSQITPEPEQFIILDGERFHFTDYGNGEEVILCLHGFALSSLSYISARDYIDISRYRILALDLKGNGFSAKPRNSDYSLEKQASVVEQFLKEMEVQQVNLVGHSYGGMVCLFLNYKQSSQSLSFRIESTTLLDTPAYNRYIPFFMKTLKTKVGSQLFLNAPPLNIKSRIAINGAFYNYKFGVSNYLDVYKTLLGQKEYPNSLHQVANQVIPDNFKEVSDSYKTFDEPFLIIWGSHDSFIDIRHAQNLMSDIENSRLVIIEETAHNPHEEKPEVVFGLIQEFIEAN